jgi:hypothetical protein
MYRHLCEIMGPLNRGLLILLPYEALCSLRDRYLSSERPVLNEPAASER